jgi:hypothetical protein
MMNASHMIVFDWHVLSRILSNHRLSIGVWNPIICSHASDMEDPVFSIPKRKLKMVVSSSL